jgi:hypothetical protein
VEARGVTSMTQRTPFHTIQKLKTLPQEKDYSLNSKTSPLPSLFFPLHYLSEDPFVKTADNLQSYYDMVNNAAIYDPLSNTFYRIPHPVPVDDPSNDTQFAPSDLFCTGHMHLPNGNVLFTGGTQV